MRWLCVLLLILLLSGCGQAGKREVRSYRLHGAACEQLGYKATSDAWSDCAKKLERARAYASNVRACRTVGLAEISPDS